MNVSPLYKLLFTVVAGVLIVSGLVAQESGKLRITDANWREVVASSAGSDAEPHKLFLAQPMAVVKFDESESARWFGDFFLSPARAKDRVVVHGYNLESLDRDTITLLARAIESDPSAMVGLVSTGDDGMRVIGGDIAYFGVPILWNDEFKEILLRETPAERALSVSKLMLRAFGFDQEVDATFDDGSLPIASPKQMFIATSKRVEDAQLIETPMLASKDAWPTFFNVDNR